MKAKNDPIRFGIVGCGVVAPLHAEAIHACPYTELVAVADVDGQKAAKFATEYGIERSYGDIGEMLALDDLDVISVCTPSGLHGDTVIQAARAGKHVLCEKPLEVSGAKMTEMIDSCRRHGVLLGVLYQRRASGVAKLVKQAIDAGEIGKLVLCDAYLKYYRDQAYYDSAGWRGTWAMDGGGALMNQGVHGVDMIQWLTGGVESLYAKASALARRIEVEDTAVALVQYKNGAYGVIEAATTVYPEHSTRFELHGERGTISFDDTGILEWNVLGKGNLAETMNPGPDIVIGARSAGHYHFIEDMALAVKEGRAPLVPGEEARKAVDIILAIYESSRTHREIVLPSIL